MIVRDVAELDRDAVAHGHGDVGERLGIGDAAADADQLLGRAARHASRGHFLILALQRLRDLHRAHVVGAHRVRIELHFDLALRCRR